MITKKDLKQVSPVLWEIPKSYRGDMRVAARVYASEAMLPQILEDQSLTQLINAATLPGVSGYALVMPDVHEGYGLPVGGVVATIYPHGVISPGGIGYDINCGVRLLTSTLTFLEVESRLENLTAELYRRIPSGVGRSGALKLEIKDLDQVLKLGVKWAEQEGYADEDDSLYIESSGSLEFADPAAVSEHAKKRGHDQLGTMGAGNHFVEIDVVDEIFDEAAGRTLGLFKGQVAFLIHSGSRGLGHQVATDYIREMLRVLPRYKITLPDRELAGVPYDSPEGKRYFGAMSAAANFAWTNRQMIAWAIRRQWKEVMGEAGGRITILYDVAHNIAKIEEYEIHGKMNKLIVHRKGATRAYPPGHDEVPEPYRTIGQPVLIPGSMGTASYVLVGTEGAMKDTFGSSCHGAGRRMSRKQAKREVRGDELRAELEGRGIHIQAGSLTGLAEEAPTAYKDVEQVVDVVATAGIAKKVALLRQVGVIKG